MFTLLTEMEGDESGLQCRAMQGTLLLEYVCRRDFRSWIVLARTIHLALLHSKSMSVVTWNRLWYTGRY